jgi:hypothetical protein
MKHVIFATILLFASLTLAYGQELPDLWAHVYHPSRLRIIQARATVTGVIVDATAGKQKDLCRHEKDGDGHCWLRLDPGQEQFLNQENLDKQGGNIVYEPICRYKVTQADAISACEGFHQQITIPPAGSHVRLTGSHVLDTQHGHMEIHPVSAIEVIP